MHIPAVRLDRFEPDHQHKHSDLQGAMQWSTSSQEYEQIVQDYFESYSERGVAEKTDASMSTENESRHSNVLNFGATLSGSYGPTVSLTTTLGLTNTKDERESVKHSIQCNREVTEKASARARQEHKVSIKLEQKKGVEDNSFKTITNLSSSAVRIDYYRLMRKWRTDLFRYGLRLTYDITIPAPGLRFWARWERLSELESQVREPFTFTLKPEDLTDGNWPDQAAAYGVSLEPPPDPNIALPSIARWRRTSGAIRSSSSLRLLATMSPLRPRHSSHFGDLQVIPPSISLEQGRGCI